MMHACPICCFATSTSICASCARRHEDRCSPLPAPDADEAEVIRWAAAHGIGIASVRIRAECAWGDGPDVLVEFGMRSGEARQLAADLLNAADHADDLERGWIEAGKKP